MGLRAVFVFTHWSMSESSCTASVESYSEGDFLRKSEMTSKRKGFSC